MQYILYGLPFQNRIPWYLDQWERIEVIGWICTKCCILPWKLTCCCLKFWYLSRLLYQIHAFSTTTLCAGSRRDLTRLSPPGYGSSTTIHTKQRRLTQCQQQWGFPSLHQPLLRDHRLSHCMLTIVCWASKSHHLFFRCITCRQSAWRSSIPIASVHPLHFTSSLKQSKSPFHSIQFQSNRITCLRLPNLNLT